MAKKKKSAEPDTSTTSDEVNEAASKAGSPEDLERVKRRNVVATSVIVALAFSVIGFIGWHRPRDPGRVWYKRVQSGFSQQIEGTFQRCFGASDGAAIRRSLPELRRGVLPTTLRGCRGSALTEVIAAPLAFGSNIGAPPGYAENQKLRVIDAVERLRASGTAYERAVDDLPASAAAVPEASRDPIANGLDQVATDVDGLRNAVRDLGVVVEDNASWY